MSNPDMFKILNSISNKQDFFEGEDLKEYNPFMINRFLAMGNDTILFANEASKMSNIPKELQYLFLYHGINKKKRYFKYIKGDIKEQSIKNICNYYQVREDVGLEYLDILSNEQIKEINSLYEKRLKGC